MKCLALILPCLAMSGCVVFAPARREANYTDTHLPGPVYSKLTDEAVNAIAVDFDPIRDRLGFFGSTESHLLANRLESRLRERGYEVETVGTRIFTPREIKRRTSRGVYKSYTIDEAPSPEWDEVPATISYAVEETSAGFIYFTISVGPDWQLTRIYSLTEDGNLEPHTPATIKHNPSYVLR